MNGSMDGCFRSVFDGEGDVEIHLLWTSLPTKLSVCALHHRLRQEVVIRDGCTALHYQICLLKMFVLCCGG